MTFASRAAWAGLLVWALILPSRAAGQLGFGVTGGISLSTIAGDDARGDLETRTGFNGGAFVEFPLGDILWLSPGLYYIQKGADGTLDSYAIDYLEVPLLVRVGVSERNPIGVNLFLGPTFGFQVKCDVILPSGTSSSCEDQAAANLDLTKSFDLGLAVGAGLSYAVSPTLALLANAMWDLGLMSMDESSAKQDVKNEAILLNVGFAMRPAR